MNMNIQACHDCHGTDGACMFYHCNMCCVDVCEDCILNHQPSKGIECAQCTRTLCEVSLLCHPCSEDTNYLKCQTCPHPHLADEIFTCSNCKLKGCEETIGLCEFISDGVSCDKHICFGGECGYGCREECGLARCSFDHAERCRECGCVDSVRCGLCQRDIENGRGPICIDCNNGFHPGKYRDDDEYDYEWVNTELSGRWDITPKEKVREKEEKVREKEEKKEGHEQNGYWYTWVEPGIWDCVDYSDEFGYDACDD